MAEQLGRGLQNLVDRCNSGSRLHGTYMPFQGEWWNGIHGRLKICWASAHVGSTPTSPRFFGTVEAVCEEQALRLGQLAQLVRAFP